MLCKSHFAVFHLKLRHVGSNDEAATQRLASMSTLVCYSRKPPRATVVNATQRRVCHEVDKPGCSRTQLDAEDTGEERCTQGIDDVNGTAEERNACCGLQRQAESHVSRQLLVMTISFTTTASSNKIKTDPKTIE